MGSIWRPQSQIRHSGAAKRNPESRVAKTEVSLLRELISSPPNQPFHPLASIPLWIPGSAARPRNDGEMECGCQSDPILTAGALAALLPSRCGLEKIHANLIAMEQSAMFDHVEFPVGAIGASRKFFAAVLGELGVEEFFFDRKAGSAGFGKGDVTGLLIFEGDFGPRWAACVFHGVIGRTGRRRLRRGTECRRAGQWRTRLPEGLCAGLLCGVPV